MSLVPLNSVSSGIKNEVKAWYGMNGESLVQYGMVRYEVKAWYGMNGESLVRYER